LANLSLVINIGEWLNGGENTGHNRQEGDVMGLKDINLKPVYYSDEDDLLQEFYIPVLSNSVKYDRIAGYFSSNSLAIAAKGIGAFINVGGKIRLIANVVLSEEDQQAIKQALLEKEIEVLSEIENLEDQLRKDHIRMLGWMVKNDLLEIKIAVVQNGVEHQKIGILTDSDDNIISFSGSDNETVKGWLYNDEQFHVFCRWKEGDIAHLFPDIDRFNYLWQDKGNRVRVFSVSDAFTKGLIRNAPSNDIEFKKLSSSITKELLQINSLRFDYRKKPRKIQLRDYQKSAIEKWVANRFKCIFEMATGTGKTFAALGCVEHLLEKEENLVVIITTPYTHLGQQWQKEIKTFGLKLNPQIVADSSNRSWRHQLADGLSDITLGHLNKVLVLATHRTFSSNDFIKIIVDNKKDFNILLIADEVHYLGATKAVSGLLDEYDYRLALSATPKRWFDDIGTKTIFDFFSDVVFKFGLKQAIDTINPDTNQTYLTPFKYNPIFISLNDDEIEEYINLTKSIINKLVRHKNEDTVEEQINILCFIRANIIKSAKNKYESLGKIIDEHLEDIAWTIIYCNPEQIDAVMREVNERDIGLPPFLVHVL
jgi:superfamily II DNA or RNA helicase